MATNVIWWQTNDPSFPSDLFNLPGPITTAPISAELYQLNWYCPKGACSLGPLPVPPSEPHQGQTRTSDAWLTTPDGNIHLSSVTLEPIALPPEPPPQMQLYICCLSACLASCSGTSGQFIAQASTSGPPPEPPYKG